MPSTLHFVRHAQGFHNLGPQFYSLRDPKLTPHGESQCATLRAQLPTEHHIEASRIALVAASPLSRTIHTASLVFQETLQDGRQKILALPTAQETSDYPCDTGCELDVLGPKCREHGWSVDLSRVPADWCDKGPDGPYAPTDTKLRARAKETRRILREEVRRLERETNGPVEVALVTHGGLLHYLTGDWELASTTAHGTGWTNCETRSYTFSGQGPEEEAYVAETAESRQRRGMSAEMAPAGGPLQQQWFEDAMNAWEALGLQTGLTVERDAKQKAAAAAAADAAAVQDQHDEMRRGMPAGPPTRVERRSSSVVEVAA